MPGGPWVGMSAGALAAVAGVDPWTLRDDLAAGDPGAIDGMAAGWRSATTTAAETVDTGRSASQTTAQGFLADGAPAHDAGTATNKTSGQLGDGGADMARISTTLTGVSQSLTGATTAATSTVTELEGALDSIAAEFQAYMTENAGRFLPGAALLSVLNAIASLVSTTGSFGGQVKNQVESYENDLSMAMRTLSAMGFLPAEPPDNAAPEDDGGFLSDLWNGARDVVGRGVRGSADALGAAADYLIDEAGNEIAAVVDLATGRLETISAIAQGAGGLLSGVSGPIGEFGSQLERDAGGLRSDIAAIPDNIQQAFDGWGDQAGAATERGIQDFGSEITAVNEVWLDPSVHPQTAQHVQDAQSGTIWRGDQSSSGEPKPSVLTIDREGADARGRDALRGIPVDPRDTPPRDRDEYPPKVFGEGGSGASVQYIDRGDNRSAGAYIRNQIAGLENGEQVEILVR